MYLTKTASAVLDVLTADLLPGCNRHVGGTVRKPTTPYMAVCIEALGGNQFSVAHYFVQEGDLCQDPEMVFAKVPSGGWVACYFQQALPPVYHVAHEVDDQGYPTKVNPRWAADLTSFATTWMRNITHQQGGDKGNLAGLRAAVAAATAAEDPDAFEPEEEAPTLSPEDAEAIRQFNEAMDEDGPAPGGTAGAGFLRPVQLSLAF